MRNRADMPHNQDPNTSRGALAGLTPLLVWDLAALVEKDWAERLAPYSLASNDFRVLAVCLELERLHRGGNSGAGAG